MMTHVLYSKIVRLNIFNVYTLLSCNCILCTKPFLYFFRKSTEGQLERVLSLETIQMKERAFRLSSSSPFNDLEVITTLGVGGFGRVELVRDFVLKIFILLVIQHNKYKT